VHGRKRYISRHSQDRIVVDHQDITMNTSNVDEKYRSLALMFGRFKFPFAPRPSSSSIEDKYFGAVKALYALDQLALDSIAQESLQEWELWIEMGQNPETRNSYLAEFTGKVETAIEKTNEDIEDAFNESQSVLTQGEHEEPFGITRITRC
jgi:hypothetical protein